MQRSENLTFIILIAVFLTLSVNADNGPNPTMEFILEYETTNPVKLIEGFQIESDDRDFLSYDTINSTGPLGFFCTQEMCRSVAFSYKKYHKLSIIFDDITRVSNVFEKNRGINIVYRVIVTDNDLYVEESASPFLSKTNHIRVFLIALAIILILELTVAYLFLLIIKKPKKILYYIIAANILSLPFIWFSGISPIIIAEVIIFFFEALFIFMFCRKYLSIWMSFLISGLINIISFGVGGILYLIYYFY